MKAKDTLIDKLCILFLKHGYAIKCVLRSCFDIVARGPDATLLLRVLKDANALSQEGAAEMRRVAGMLTAVPLVIADTAGKKLEDGVVYMRARIYTLNVKTLNEALKGNHPMLMSSTAGLTFSLSGERLRSKREERGFSRTDLSRRLGISAKMVDKYENDASAVTFTRGLRLYDLFGEEVFHPINLFECVVETHPYPQLRQGDSSEIAMKYSELGFDVAEVNRVPFDVLARNEREVILTEVGDTVNPEVQSLALLVDADNLVIFERTPPKEKDLPSMTREDFLKIEKAKELVKFLKEF